MREPQFEPGTILADKYRLDFRLGEGGMGTVYQATHLLLKAPVAIKVIDRELSEGDVAFSRFMREAQAAASLRSPHVVQVLDYGTEKGRPFMVMELLEGESLADRIDRIGTLTPQETYRVLSHVARAVGRAHEAGIIHRDLKPDNVFLVHNEGDELAKVLDFGIAKVETSSPEEGGHTRTGSLLGTPYYMSPEQAQGNKEVDYRSDLWTLGVIAFECLTGKRPFYSEGLGEVVLQICIRDIPRPSDYATVPAGFDDWFARATERDVSARFQSAREMIEALGVSLGLQKEALGGAGEGPWSTAAPMPASGVQSGRRPAEEATTERDAQPASLRTGVVERDQASSSPRPPRSAPHNQPPSSPSNPAASSPRSAALSPLPKEIHRTEGQGGARWEESVEPPEAVAPQTGSVRQDSARQDSQWEIVPHGQRSEPPPPPARNLALELALAEDHRRPGSALLLGLIFLILGAAAVILVGAFTDYDFRALLASGQELLSPAPARTPAPKKKAAQAPDPSAAEDPAAATPRPTPASTPTPSRKSRPDGAAGPTAPGDSTPGEEDALDAIEAAAAQASGTSGTGKVGGKTGSAADPSKAGPEAKPGDGEPKAPATRDDAKTATEPSTDAPNTKTPKTSPDASATPAPGADKPKGTEPVPSQPPAGPQPEVPRELAPPPPPPPSP